MLRQRHESLEQGPGRGLIVGVAALEDALRFTADRAAQSAELLVLTQGDRALLTPVEQLGERELQERQRARPVEHLCRKRGGQPPSTVTPTRAAGSTIASCNSAADIGVTGKVAAATTGPSRG